MMLPFIAVEREPLGARTSEVGFLLSVAEPIRFSDTFAFRALARSA